MRASTACAPETEPDIMHLTKQFQSIHRPLLNADHQFQLPHQMNRRGRTESRWRYFGKFLLQKDLFNTLHLMANLESGLRTLVRLHKQRTFHIWRQKLRKAGQPEPCQVINVSIQCDNSKLSRLGNIETTPTYNLARYESGGLLLVQTMLRRWRKKVRRDPSDTEIEHEVWTRAVERYEQKSLSQKANLYLMRRKWRSLSSTLMHQNRVHNMKVISAKHHAKEMMVDLIRRYISHSRHAMFTTGKAKLVHWRMWLGLTLNLKIKKIEACLEENLKRVDHRTYFRDMVLNILMQKKRERFLLARRKLDLAVEAGKAKKCAEHCFKTWKRKFIAKTCTKSILRKVFVDAVDNFTKKAASIIQRERLEAEKIQKEKLFLMRKYLIRWRIRMSDIMKQGNVPELSLVVKLPINFNVRNIARLGINSNSFMPLRTAYNYHNNRCNELADSTATAACKRFNMHVPNCLQVLRQKADVITHDYAPETTLKEQRLELTSCLTDLIDFDLDTPISNLSRLVKRKTRILDGHESQYRSGIVNPDIPNAANIDLRLDPGTVLVRQSLQKARQIQLRKRVKSPKYGINVSLLLDFPEFGFSPVKNRSVRVPNLQRIEVPPRDIPRDLFQPRLDLRFLDLASSVQTVTRSCLQNQRRFHTRTKHQKSSTVDPAIEQVANSINCVVNVSRRRKPATPTTIPFNLGYDLVDRSFRGFRLGYCKLCQKAAGKVFLPALPVFGLAFGTSYRPHRRRLNSDEHLLQIMPFDVTPYVSASVFNGFTRKEAPQSSLLDFNDILPCHLPIVSSTDLLQNFSLAQIPKCASPRLAVRDVVDVTNSVPDVNAYVEPLLKFLAKSKTLGDYELPDEFREFIDSTLFGDLQVISSYINEAFVWAQKKNVRKPKQFIKYELPGPVREFIDSTLYGDLQVISSYINEAFVWAQKKHKHRHKRPIEKRESYLYDSESVVKKYDMALDAVLEGTAISAMWLSFATTFKNLRLRKRHHLKDRFVQTSSEERNRKMFNFIGRESE